MAVIRLQHTIPHSSALPKDRVVNTFHFSMANPYTQTDLASINTAIQAFYSANQSTGSALANFLGNQLDTPNTRITMYDLSDQKPRVPVFEATYNPGEAGASVTNLPNEVAICLSYSAVKTSGVNMARRRGRIYLGPLASTAMTAVAGQDPRPSTSFLTTAKEACQDLLAASNAAAGWEWTVYSPTTVAGGGVGLATVASGWIDNAFDTQRRRGVHSTARTTW